MKRRKTIPAPPEKDNTPLVIAAYVLTLTLLVFAPYLPVRFNWGLRSWSYLPDIVRYALFVIGLLAIPAIRYFIDPRNDTRWRDESPAPPWMFAILILAFGSAFYFLKSNAHYLGDGYFQISNIASANPLVKSRDYGESIVHLLTRKLIGGDPAAGALAAYRYLSIFAGAAFLVSVAWAARRLYERRTDQFLFFLILASGGYALLFFGYVENYSLLALAIGLFTLMGILAGRGALSSYWALLPAACAVFFHRVGIVLIPAAVYLLFTCEPPLRRLVSRIRPPWKLAISGSVLALGVAAFVYLYTTDYYFRFAFLPVVRNRFTLEGYTLFSARHILDYLNLLLMLAPAVALLVVYARLSCPNKPMRTRESAFLFVLVASTLVAAFVLDPKLGMPRDWDLFSFPGIPMTALLAALIIRGGGVGNPCHHGHARRHSATYHLTAACFGAEHP